MVASTGSKEVGVSSLGPKMIWVVEITDTEGKYPEQELSLSDCGQVVCHCISVPFVFVGLPRYLYQAKANRLERTAACNQLTRLGTK